MSTNSSVGSRSVLWSGKPWIVPSAVTRSVTVFVVAAVVFSLELSFDMAFRMIPGLSSINVPVIVWTGLVLFLAWILSLVHLLLLRASITYVLRDDSLEIRSGIVTSRSFVVTASGFSDLEVIRTVSARIVGSGDIIIRTQSETDSVKRMQKVRNPLKVADQIREVMAKPIVRIEGQDHVEDKK